MEVSVTMGGYWLQGVMKGLSDCSMWRESLYLECSRDIKGESLVFQKSRIMIILRMCFVFHREKRFCDYSLK